jgi:hypothetical protein
MEILYLPSDFRAGCCDRCGQQAPVVPEIGPLAENVCRPCLQQAFEADYREYRQLLAGDMQRLAL